MKPFRQSHARRAFTLIEIMIVVAIMAVIVAMGLPPILQSVRPASIRKAALDLQEVCRNARARAILNGVMTEVVFHPLERRFEVSGASSGASDNPVSPTGLSAQLPEDIKFEMLDVNLRECKEEESARVRFFPNGTSDEMTVIFVSDSSERRAISLEITTALAYIETDVRRLK